MQAPSSPLVWATVSDGGVGWLEAGGCPDAQAESVIDRRPAALVALFQRIARPWSHCLSSS
eukprot:4252205-Lingulodinium_polyedra.AAC.1